MIYDELRNYLSISTDLDTVEMFDKAIEIFEKFEIPDYMDIFQNVVGDNTDVGDLEVIDNLKLMLSKLLDRILVMHGVVLNSECTYTHKLAYAEGMYRICNYEDRSTILLILENVQSTQESFAELMQLVTPYCADVTLSFLESVEDTLISSMKRIYVDPEVNKIQFAEDVEKQTTAYLKIKEKLFSNSPCWADKYFNYQEAIALPFITYLSIYIKEKTQYLTNDISDTGMKILAMDLLSIAALSEESISNSILTIRKYSDKIYTDINLITKLDLMINKLLMEYHNA